MLHELMKMVIVGTGRLSTVHGGGEVYARHLVHGLADKHHQIIYLSLLASGEIVEKRWFEHEGVKECQLVLPSVWFKWGGVLEQPAVVDAVANLLDEISPDVIHANGWKQVSCLAAAQVGIPCVVTAHHGGIVCPAGALLNDQDEICLIPASDRDCLRCCGKNVPGFPVWYRFLKAIPLTVRLRVGMLLRKLPFVPLLTPLGQISWVIRKKQEEVKDIADRAARIVAPSPAIQAALIRNGMPIEKIRMVPHGIPIPDAACNSVRSAHKPLRLIYIGRINRVKGLHILLAACQGLCEKDYELHVVGGAFTRYEKRYLTELQRRFSSVRAVWHGQRTHEEIDSHIAACDVMVHPAICLEVFGLTISESLAAGCPVVSTRCGGPEIQIRDGVNGLLVPPNDAAALRAALKRLMDAPSLVAEMSRRAGVVHSVEAHVSDLQEIYCSLGDER